MPTDRRDFLKQMPFALAQPPAAARRPPSVIFVMADQLRAGITRNAGYPLDVMPAVDRLAREGVGFDCCYATSPLCSPSRTSLLTGRWPSAHRVRENPGLNHAFFEKDIYDVLKPLGYKTGLAGKNHTYLKQTKLDFWRSYMHGGGWKAPNAAAEVAEFDRWLMKLNHAVHKEPTPFPLETQLPYRIVSDSIEFIDSAGEQPYALWVSFPEPHNPYQCPKPYFGMFPPESVPARGCGPEALPKKGFKWEMLRRLQEETYPGYDNHWRLTKSIYLGMARLIDDQVKRLVEFVERSPQRDNTIIVFTSDHGDYLTDYGLMRKGVENPECLIRIPMVFWGRMLKGGQPHHNAHISNADVMPTICEATGVEIPKGVQGRSLWPLLTGGDYPKEEFRSTYAEVGYGGLFYDKTDNIDFNTCRIPGPPGAVPSFDELNSYTQSGYLRTVRMGNWKLDYDMMGHGQLYNLAADPLELNNLYNDSSAARQKTQMLEELLAWSIRAQDNLPTARYRAKWAKRNWYAKYRI